MSIANALRTLIPAAALLLSVPSATAQVSSSLPGSIVQSGTVSGAARQQITDFVESVTGSLDSDDIRNAARAREQLLRPLQDRDVSVAFRQAYGEALGSMLDSYSESEDVQQRLLALRVGGELATSDSVRIIRKHLTSSDAGIRLFSIGRVQRVFEMTSAHGPAISSSEATGLVRLIAKQAESTADPIELDGIVRALAAGASLPGSDLSGARNASVQSMESVVSPILRGLEPNGDTQTAYRLALRAASAMTGSIIDVNASTDAAALKASIGLAGDMLSVPLRQIFAGYELEGAERELAIRSVQSAEALLYFARKKQPGGSQVAQTGFADLLEQGENRDFRNSVSLLLDANSKLVGDNGFEANRFVTK